MHVRVKNQGPDAAPGSLMKVQVVRQGRILATRIVAVPPLAAGAVSPPLFVVTTPHVHPRIVRMKVDAGNQVAEANEANNVRETPLP
jgi:subtilase family serine protease